MTFAEAERAGKRKQTCWELCLIEMDQVVPWQGLIFLTEPHYPNGENGRPAYPLRAMLRVHLLQTWFGYSDPVMEDVRHETTILRQFAGLSLACIPDESTILNLRRLLEKHELAAGILAVLNALPEDRKITVTTTVGSSTATERWWKLDKLSGEDGNPLSGWVRENEFITPRLHPWDWEGFDFINETSTPGEQYGCQLSTDGVLDDGETFNYTAPSAERLRSRSNEWLKRWLFHSFQ